MGRKESAEGGTCGEDDVAAAAEEAGHVSPGVRGGERSAWGALSLPHHVPVCPEGRLPLHILTLTGYALQRVGILTGGRRGSTTGTGDQNGG